MAISRRSKNLIAIAARPDAFLIVDEAHTGVYGEQGRELTAPCEGRENLPVVHTCGKALGAAGALVTASGVLRNLMVNRCRPFIFAAAPSSLPSPCGQPLSILQEESERQQHLAKLVTFAHRQMRKRGWQSPSGSQIVPCSRARPGNLCRTRSGRHCPTRGRARRHSAECIRRYRTSNRDGSWRRFRSTTFDDRIRTGLAGDRDQSAEWREPLPGCGGQCRALGARWPPDGHHNSGRRHRGYP